VWNESRGCPFRSRKQSPDTFTSPPPLSSPLKGEEIKKDEIPPWGRKRDGSIPPSKGRKLLKGNPSFKE